MTAAATPAEADAADTSRTTFATYRAELARLGWELRASAGGGWLVLRWGHARELRDLEAVGRFAAQVGVPA